MAIFVFGSNQAGIHGGGAARFAVLNHGAIFYQGERLQGMSYALPTMDKELQPLPLEEVRASINRFLEFAIAHPELEFHVTAVGCGIAGFTREQIIPMFAGAPRNCFFFEEAFGKKVPEAEGAVI
jgi:hypothetical protein